MTGIERLHKLIADIDVSADPELWYILRGGTEGGWGCEEHDDKTLGSTLAAIAEQIKREQGERVSFMRVLAVISDMESHASGVEGAEDSPVARWARELRAALGGYRRDPAADVSVSAYDLLPQEEREAIAWVRDHGGIDHVRAEWRSRSNLKRTCEKEKAKVERQQRHIEHVQGVCKTRAHRIVELNKTVAEMRPRLMPEGMEWPRYEDGDPVRIWDKIEDIEVRSIVFNEGGILLSDCTSVPGWGTWRSYKERVKRPAVPAADGEPLREGEHVYHVETGAELVVKKLPKPGEYQAVVVFALPTSPASHLTSFDPDQLTHQRPDTWQRIEEDSTLSPEVYCHRNGIDISQKDGTEIFLADTVEPMARDLVRRCRALAERERGL